MEFRHSHFDPIAWSRSGALLVFIFGAALEISRTVYSTLRKEGS
jgi:hypothetical protein